VFDGRPGVTGWEANGSAAYEVAVTEAGLAAPEVARALVAAGVDILSLGEQRHSLEDVYLELISEDVVGRADRAARRCVLSCAAWC
jgi:ABC-2 type transport system ATP-binding protein